MVQRIYRFCADTPSPLPLHQFEEPCKLRSWKQSCSIQLLCMSIQLCSSHCSSPSHGPYELILKWHGRVCWDMPLFSVGLITQFVAQAEEHHVPLQALIHELRNSRSDSPYTVTDYMLFRLDWAVLHKSLQAGLDKDIEDFWHNRRPWGTGK